MSSSTDRRPVAAAGHWSPELDLTPGGLSRFDPARVTQAIEDGYRTGFDAGSAEARAQAQQELDALVGEIGERARTLLESLAAAGRRLEAAEVATAGAYADAVAEAAVAVAQAILGRELADPTQAALAAVQRTLGAVDRTRAVRIQVHPDDLELLGDVELPDGVSLDANPGLRPGDAVGSTDDRTVDARIATALDRARAALSGDPHATADGVHA